jgi:hypothetical protein
MYVSAVLMGGLGNRLFQMAAAEGVAQATGRTAVIHLPSVCTNHNQIASEAYENTIFSQFAQVTDNVDTTHKAPDWAPFVYLNIPPCSAPHLQLYGYFQNERHVPRDFVNKLNLPVLDPAITESLKNTCFIHVRFGDYLHNPLHYIDLTGAYLEKAINIHRALRPHVHFMVFSDDIERCKELTVLSTLPNTSFAIESNEVTAIVKMSNCLAGAICWNSSFSWWGAYLNKNPDKTVVFPSKWMNKEWPVDIQFEGSIIIKV